MQIMPYEDAADYRFNPFDITKVWPHQDYPTIPIGRMVLDRNPENFFAQIEQAAFAPAHMVPGIGPSPDKMLQGRLFSYPDTQRYRIGPNYLQLPVNQPKSEVHSYNRDGQMAYINGGDPVYAPNSYGGPVADPSVELPTWQVEAGEVHAQRRLRDHLVEAFALRLGTELAQGPSRETRARVPGELLGGAVHVEHEAGTVHVFHGFGHVRHQFGELRPEFRGWISNRAEHGIAEQADGPDGHVSRRDARIARRRRGRRGCGPRSSWPASGPVAARGPLGPPWTLNVSVVRIGNRSVGTNSAFWAEVHCHWPATGGSICSARLAAA